MSDHPQVLQSRATSRQQPPAGDQGMLARLLSDDWLDTFQRVFPFIVAQELQASGHFKGYEHLLASFLTGGLPLTHDE